MPHANLSSFLPNTHTHRVTAATLVTPVVFQCHCLRLTHTPTDAQLRRARGRLRSRHGGHAVWQVSPSRRAARLFRSDARDIHSRLDVRRCREPFKSPPPQPSASPPRGCARDSTHRRHTICVPCGALSSVRLEPRARYAPTQSSPSSQEPHRRIFLFGPFALNVSGDIPTVLTRGPSHSHPSRAPLLWGPDGLQVWHPAEHTASKVVGDDQPIISSPWSKRKFAARFSSLSHPRKA
jgi:hypothetical protein